MPTRDQNPLLAGFAIPAPLPARLASQAQWSVALDINWANTALIQNDATQSLLVDVETREVRLTLAHALTDQATLRVQLPYRYSGAGVLDRAIDSWHDLFGLPEGDRPLLPRDGVRIQYAREGLLLLDIESSRGGLADLSLDFGLALASTARTAASAWFSVKLPTGQADQLTGSGAADLSVALSGEHRHGKRWRMFGQAAAIWLGKGDVLREQQRNLLWSALAGLGWQAGRNLQFKVQIDGHSAVFDQTGLDFLSEALVLSFGGEYRFAGGWRLDLGISEDIVYEASPDVVLVLGLNKVLGSPPP